MTRTIWIMMVLNVVQYHAALLNRWTSLQGFESTSKNARTCDCFHEALRIVRVQEDSVMVLILKTLTIDGLFMTVKLLLKTAKCDD